MYNIPEIQNQVMRKSLIVSESYVSDDVLTNTALTFDVESESKYILRFVLFVDTTASSRDVRLDFDGTLVVANFTGQWYQYQSDVPTMSNPRALRVTAIGTDFDGDIPTAQSTILFDGLLETTDAGTFTLRGCQVAPDVGAVIIQARSYGILIKLN